MLRLWLQMLPSFLCSAPVVCWLALSDLSKSPLLHILQLVPPLEPKRRGGWYTHLNQYTPYESVYHCEPLMTCYITLRQRSLLGSFSWFDQVPLLQTLEAVFEDAALWLQSRSITGGERGETSPDKSKWDKCHSVQFPPKLNNPIHNTKADLSIIQRHNGRR